MNAAAAAAEAAGRERRMEAARSGRVVYSLPSGRIRALPPLIGKIASWLRPGGLLVATMAGGEGPGTVEPNLLGAPMYFSGYAVEDNRRFVEAGLEIESAREEFILENVDVLCD